MILTCSEDQYQVPTNNNQLFSIHILKKSPHQFQIEQISVHHLRGSFVDYVVSTARRLGDCQRLRPLQYVLWQQYAAHPT